MRNRALHIREKTLPPDHPDLAMSWNNLGVQYFNQKRYDDAREAYEKALAINRKAYGNDHSEVALALANLSEVNEVRNDFDGARALLLEALEIEEKGNRDSTRSAIFLARLGRTEVAMKRYEQALPRLERAIRMLEKSKSNEAQLALSRFAMAKVLWEHKHDKQAARALAEKAKQGPFAGADLKPIVSEIEDWLRTHR
jgi:tetratricopeptide (TPR) repeat protein